MKSKLCECNRADPHSIAVLASRHVLGRTDVQPALSEFSIYTLVGDVGDPSQVPQGGMGQNGPSKEVGLGEVSEPTRTAGFHIK